MIELKLTVFLFCSGGEEVLLDVGGQDGTEAFEDVGHSDEARELLDDMLVGTLKRMVSLYTILQFAQRPLSRRILEQTLRRKAMTNNATHYSPATQQLPRRQQLPPTARPKIRPLPAWA